MKKVIFSVLVILFASFVQGQDFNVSMVEIMKSMKEYTIEMIDLMPEENFDFKPTDSVRTFREQVQHIISTNHFLLNYQLKGNGEGDVQKALLDARKYADVSSKEDLLLRLTEQLDQSIDFFGNTLSSVYGKTYTFGTPDAPIVKDYFAVAMLIRDHITHHRAQLIAYLRLNNIKPAPYRAF